jgi:hypothetical protein
MFEQNTVKTEKDRSQTIMILSGLAVLVVIALIIIVTSFARRPSHTEMSHAGSAEFDSYAANIKLGNLDKRSGERLNIRYARILSTAQNIGDGVLAGLQLRAAVIGMGGQLIKDKIITLVPNSRDTLGPNQTVNVDVSIEHVPDPSEISDMTLELYGLKLK